MRSRILSEKQDLLRVFYFRGIFMYDVIILGAGTAGMTAALYTNRAGLNTLIVEQELYGGQIVNTPEIENYPALPGYPDLILFKISINRL